MKFRYFRLAWIFALLVIVSLVAAQCAGVAPTEQPTQEEPAAEQPAEEEPAAEEAMGEPVTLRIAWMGAEYETYQEWKQAFEAEHPNVTIEYQFIPYAEGPTVYTTMIEGGNPPDLAYLFMGLVPEYAERGAIESLDGYMTDADRAEWVAAGLDAGVYKGETYAVPLLGANRTLFVRTDLMQEAGYDEPPATWDEVIDLAQKMNNPPEVYGFCIGAGRQKHIMQEQIGMMWGYGADFFDEEGKLAINSPEAVQYVTDLTNMFLEDEAMPPGILTLNANECYAEMAAGKVGMMFSGPWQDKMCTDGGFECEALMLPGPMPDGVHKMLLIVDVFGMFSASENKELAYEFIKFIQRPENRALFDEEFGGVPLTHTVADTAYYESQPIQNYIAQTDLLRLTPKHPEWTKIQDGWGEAVQLVLAGDATAEEALNTVYDRLMGELEDPNLPTGAAPAEEPAAEEAMGEPVTLRIAWMGAEYETYQEWKQAFETEHPNVTIEYQFIPYAEGPTVYTTMIEGGNPPDLAYLFMGLVPEYAERGAIEPLDGYMTDADRAEWVAAGLDAGVYKGETYAVPLLGANRTLFVRTDLMQEAGYDEPPATWDEVIDLAQKMNNPPEVYGFCIGAGRQKHIMQEQIGMMWGYGADFFDEEGKLAINSPEAVQYVTDLTNMFLEDEVMPPGILTLNANECYAEMAAGKVGMMFSGPWQDKMCTDGGFECEALMLPGPMPDGVHKMLLIVDVFGMFSASENKELAYEFIKFIQRPENRALFDEEFGGVPLTHTVADTAYYESQPIQNYIAQTDLLRLTPKHPEWTKIQDGWGEAVQLVLAGDATAEEALNTVYDRLIGELEDPNLPQ